MLGFHADDLEASADLEDYWPSENDAETDWNKYLATVGVGTDGGQG